MKVKVSSVNYDQCFLGTVVRKLSLSQKLVFAEDLK